MDETHPERIAASTRRLIYYSLNGGAAWQGPFDPPGNADIRDLALGDGPDGSIVFLVATDRELFRSEDPERAWRRVFQVREGSEGIATVAFHPHRRGVTVAGTRNGVFTSEDGGRRWRPRDIPQEARQVIAVAFDPTDRQRVYLVSAEGVFVGDLDRSAWTRRAGSMAVTDDSTEMVQDGDTEPVDTAESPRLLGLAIDPQTSGMLYLATSRGLLMSSDDGLAWRSASRTGMGSALITRLLARAHSPVALYAATDRGVSRYDPVHDQWAHLSAGLVDGPVHDLAVTGQIIWAATDHGLFRYQLAPSPFPESTPPGPQELLENFTHEPTIGQVREAAIRYGEVHPEKIQRWRWQANLRALLPTVAIGYDRDDKLSITNRGSTNEPKTDRFLVMDDPSRSLDASVSWDLADLIWNTSQTSIDVRSKLMVELRQDIVDEVTRLYFERRRLQVALLTQPSTDDQRLMEQELRLRELTALIDGLTGGFFSAQLAIDVNNTEVVP